MLCNILKIFKRKKYIFLVKFKNKKIVFFAPKKSLQGVESLSVWKNLKGRYVCNMFGKVIKDDDLNKMLEITHFKPAKERKTIWSF